MIAPWLARLPPPAWPDRAALNTLAADAGIASAGGIPIRFVPPRHAGGAGYELEACAHGRVQTRDGDVHDLFNALVWLALPRTKAALNARHAARISREGGRRGRLRDLLTLLDEGGVLIAGAAALAPIAAARDWKTLFVAHRERWRDARVLLLGHAALEQSLAPWPGITCKALFLDLPADATPGEIDTAAARWIADLEEDATPKQLPALPVYGVPGWWPESEAPGFYDDARWFRPPAPSPVQ